MNESSNVWMCGLYMISRTFAMDLQESFSIKTFPLLSLFPWGNKYTLRGLAMIKASAMKEKARTLLRSTHREAEEAAGQTCTCWTLEENIRVTPCRVCSKSLLLNTPTKKVYSALLHLDFYLFEWVEKVPEKESEIPLSLMDFPSELFSS